MLLPLLELRDSPGMRYARSWLSLALSRDTGRPPSGMAAPRSATQVHLPAHPQYTQAQMMDPLLNFQAAYEISGGGQNFAPWTTYKNGAYQGYLAEADQALQQSGGLGLSVSNAADQQIGSVLAFARAARQAVRLRGQRP